MPSPIQTGGFQVQAQPGISYLDPRLFAGGLTEIIPNIGRGASMVGGLYDMQENAQLRPTRAALANIELQEAENRMAMAPLERKLASLRLGEAQQRAAIPSEIVESVDIIGGGKRLAPLNPSASFEDFTIMEEFAPKVKRTGGTRVAAGGALTPFMRDETLLTAEEIKRQNRRDDIALMAEGRRVREQASTASARSQRLALDVEKAKSPDFSKAREGLDSEGRLVTVLFNKKTGEQITIPTDLVPIKSESEAIQIINALTGGGEPKVDPKDTASGTPSFSTIEEADAAAAREGWKGTRRIMVGGRPATWQE